MKKLTLILVVLCLTLASASLSVPNIVMYRYQNNGFVRDDAKWSAGKKTALLVHGFPMFSKGKCRDGMIGLVEHLSRTRKVGGVTLLSYDMIYVVEYPAKYHILDTAAALSNMVNSKCSSWPKETKIDVFAHSMGGLVTRTAIEYPEVLLGTKNISNRVGRMVTMSTPHNGISSPAADIFKEALGQLPVEVGDMDPKGLFMNMLNFTSSKKPQVSCDYYSIVGARSYRPKKYLDGKTGFLATIVKKLQDISYPVHDGLIDAASAGYDLTEVCHAFKKTPLDLNHDYIKSHPEVFSTIDRWMIDDKWFGVASAQAETLADSSTSNSPQLLLGKTRAEIEKMFDDTVLYQDIVHGGYIHSSLANYGPGYHFNFKPNEEYNTDICFVSSGEVWDPTREYNQTRSVAISFNLGDKEISKQSSPGQIVPAKVLNAKPFCIYRSVIVNTVAVVWYIDHHTFLLLLRDEPNRPLYTTVKIDRWKNKYVVNKNTTDFHHGHVYHFAYTDKVIEVKRVPDSLGRGYYYNFWINSAAQSGMSGYLFDK